MNSPNGAGGLRRPPPLYALLVLKALASASIKSIGHPLVLKALGNHLKKNSRGVLPSQNPFTSTGQLLIPTAFKASSCRRLLKQVVAQCF